MDTILILIIGGIALATLVFALLLAFVSLRTQGQMSQEAGTMTSGPGVDETSDSSENEINLVPGQLLDFKEGSFPAKIRVESTDPEYGEAVGTLIVDLPSGSQLLNIQKEFDDYQAEVSICISFLHEGKGRTLTWIWSEADWPDTGDWDLKVDEIEVNAN